MNTSTMSERSSRASRAPLLVALVGFSLFVCLAFGWYLSAFVIAVATAIGAMVIEILLNRENRQWPKLLLLTAIAYAISNITLFVLMLTFDRFAVLGLLFMFMAVIGGPILVTIVVLILSFAQEKPYWLGIIGFVFWMGAVALANLTVIVIANGAV